MTKAPRQCNGRVIALLKRVKSPASRALSLWASVEEKASWGFWRHVQRLESCKNSGGEKENWGGRAVFSSPGNLGNPRQDDSCHLAASPATCCRETFQCASLSLYIASTREMDRTQGAGYTPLCTVINICASVLFTHMPCRRGNVPTWGGFTSYYYTSAVFLSPSRIQKWRETVSGAMYILSLSLSRGLVDVVVQFTSELSSLISVRQESAWCWNCLEQNHFSLANLIVNSHLHLFLISAMRREMFTNTCSVEGKH